MSFFSGITSALSGLGGSIISGGASLLGGIMTNETNQDIANAANQFSAQQYATRYQTTVKDLEAAGLNPMLAYSNGPGQAPTAQTMQMQNPVPAAMQSASEAANIEKTKADAAVSTATAAKILASTPKQQLEGDIYSKVRDLLTPATKSSAKHAMSDSDQAKAMIDLYGDEPAPDTRSPLHQMIDKVGEWNPYGLGL